MENPTRGLKVRDKNLGDAHITWMDGRMDGWIDETNSNAYISYGTKELAKLFKCMFNIILAISKDIILHVMILPIQLMVIIFLSYTPAAHEAMGHSGSLLVT